MREVEENYALKKWAELDQAPEKKDREVWLGVYRGVRFEINRFKGYREEPGWTHYIWIAIDEQLEPAIAEKFWLKPQVKSFSPGGRPYLHHDYYDSIVASLEFHGGITYYSKEAGFEGEPRVVKIGCDYQHLWDEGKHYSLADVESECRSTIDSLYALLDGKVKVRSRGDGKYRYIEEFE
jgi:hypothetical protein